LVVVATVGEEEHLAGDADPLLRGAELAVPRSVDLAHEFHQFIPTPRPDRD
jgi:hypothetical protein